MQLDFKLWLIRLIKFGGLGLVAVVTLIPLIRMIAFIVNNGSDNISNDYYIYAQLYDQMLGNNYDWPNRFFQDTFLVSHCLIFPIMTSLLFAIVFHWNNYVEFYFALALGGIRLFLIYNTFTYFKKDFTRWLLLPILAALTFSTSQINNFTFGQPAVAFAINLFGFALALWGMVRFEGRKLGLALIIIGGFLATWSGAMGLVVWPVAFGGMYFFKFRRIWQYITLVVAGTIAALPYFFFLVLTSSPNAQSKASFGFNYVVNALGWPFANGIGTNFEASQLPKATTAGWFSLGLGGLTLILLAVAAWRNKTILKQALPSLVLLVFGFLTTLQVGLFRAPAIAPWYTTLFIYYWIGLVGLAYVLWSNRPKANSRINQAVIGTMTLWGVGLVGILTFLYLSSNVTFDDKAFYLGARSPASAECLRHYKVAPPVCEGLLFQWGLGNPDSVQTLGSALERHELSVFAPHQQWTLQGDYLFKNVQLEEQPDLSGIFWSEDLSTSNRLPWNSYRHLNLFVHSPNSVLWTVYLPPNLERAEFNSAVALSQSAPKDSIADGVTFEIYVESEKAAPKLVYSQQVGAENRKWNDLKFSLKEYAGQTITLRLTSKPGANRAQDWAMYHYPFIDVDLQGKNNDAAVAQAERQLFLINTTDKDLAVQLDNTAVWVSDGVERRPDTPNRWTIKGNKPSFINQQPLNICLADYSEFYIRMAVAPPIVDRKIQVAYELKGASGDGRGLFYLSLYPDGEFHNYSFDLKLFEAGPKARLMTLRFDPVAPDSRFKTTLATADKWFEIADFRLIRKPGPSLCQR